ncbi:histidine kinase [Caulobacter segnis]|uniref:histidine kinase n=2 Tax=Caulobacter segnis TaxID=88688 RepID=D5VIJ7_CAUST|nr:MASE1 domain-containing protein [Caulobacter segnis]ADG09571.1 integral membrane sensor hybrid histidine kinase [Caulobacter segnis ATCC 21756]AVQ01355.1 histidine kinase [Caulobacter segnis]
MPQGLAQHERRRQAALLQGLSVALVGGLFFSEFLTRTILGVAAFWPANALLAAGLVALTPKRRLALASVFVAFHVAADLLVGDSVPRALLYAAIDTLEALALWWVCVRLWGRAPRVRTMRALAVLPAVTTPIAAVSATICAAVLSLSFGEPLLKTWVDWFLRGALGLAVVLPAALVLIDSQHRRAYRVSLVEQGSLLFAVAAVTLLCAHPLSGAPPFLIFPIALVAAYRLGARGAAMACLIVALITLPIAMSGASPRFNAILGPTAQARTIQIFIAVLFYTCMAASLVLAQQDRLRRLLQRREQLTRVARARALAATEAKTEFLATMSHEIRTPLNSVLGFAQLLAKRDDLSPDARRQVNLIDSAGAALVTVLDDILDFSRVEAGQIELQPQPTSAAELVRETVAIMAPEVRAKGLELDLDVIDPDHRHHDLDADRVRQVLINLLNNAIRFTDQGRISVRLIIDPGAATDRLRFEIVDTGVGIALEKQALLFQRASADVALGRMPSGAGLGLAICRALVDAMGGKIGVDSVPGRGSCFWFELSARRVERAAAPAPTPAAEAAVGRVLVVDDHPINLEIAATLMSMAGYEVDQAESGGQAVDRARSTAYDLILMDMHMPEMDGLQATRAIRALPAPFGTAPIIAMSADALPAQVERCYAAGMVDHIPKPVQRETLYAKVERWRRKPTLR